MLLSCAVNTCLNILSMRAVDRYTCVAGMLLGRMHTYVISLTCRHAQLQNRAGGQDVNPTLACEQRVCHSWIGCLHRYTIIKNGRQRLFMPNSHFLTSEFMVMDHDSKPRSRKRSSSTGQPVYGPPLQPDRTRPLGPVPSGAYGRWDKELQRQRMQAATRWVLVHSVLMWSRLFGLQLHR